MAKTVAMMGGNGYIARNVMAKWLAKEPETQFVVVSRSGKPGIESPRVSAVAADCTDVVALAAALPARVDAICCFVGGMNPASNVPPVRAMMRVAKDKGAARVGYIQGRLGNKDFVASKAEAAEAIREAGKRDGIESVIVNPTLVYGNGRKDSLTKMVPLLKFAGIFSKNVRPVTVDEVADELVEGMCR